MFLGWLIQNGILSKDTVLTVSAQILLVFCVMYELLTEMVTYGMLFCILAIYHGMQECR